MAALDEVAVVKPGVAAAAAMAAVDRPLSPAERELAAQQARDKLQESVDYTVLSPVAFRLVFACMCCMCFMAGLDITIVVTAMPHIANQFNCLDNISWTVTAFLLTQTAMAPLVGRLAELIGRRNTLFGSILIFTIFSLACALAQNFPQLAIFRALQGVGGGGIMPAVMIVLTDITPAATRGVAVAPIGAMFALSSITGPLLGGALTDIGEEGWRYCFWINVPIGILCMAAIWHLIPASIGAHSAKYDKAKMAAGMTGGGSAAENAMHAAKAAAGEEAPGADAEKLKTQIDYIGSLSCVIFVTAFTLAVTWGGGDYAWSDSRVVATLVIAIGFGLFFFIYEYLWAAQPIVPIRLFWVRNVWVAASLFFWSSFGMMSSVVYMPVFFQLVYGETAIQSGISLIPMMLSMPIGAMITGISMGKTGRYYLQPLIGGVLLIVASYLFTTFNGDTPISQRIGYLIIAGLSFGPGVVTPMQTAQAAVLGRDRAVMTSTITFFGMLGRLVAAALGQTILNNGLTTQYANYKAALGQAALNMMPWSPAQQYTNKQNAQVAGITPVFWLGVGAGVMTLLCGYWCVHIPLGGHGPPAASKEVVTVAVDGVPEEASKDEAAKDAATKDVKDAQGAREESPPEDPSAEVITDILAEA